MKLKATTTLADFVSGNLINDIKLDDLRILAKKVGAVGVTRRSKSITVAAIRSKTACLPCKEIQIEFNVKD